MLAIKFLLVQAPWDAHNHEQCAVAVTDPQQQPWYHTCWGLAYVGRCLWNRCSLHRVRRGLIRGHSVSSLASLHYAAFLSLI